MQYYSFIDGLRAIAVTSVVIYHLNQSLLPGGFVGVDIFFVVSGFVVASSVANLERKSFTIFVSHFYIRRITRITPALLACLIATTVLTVLFIPSAWLSLYNSVTGLAAFIGLSNFVLMYFSGDYFSPAIEFNPFTHTWSLGIEEQFYLVFPLISWLWLSKSTEKSSITPKIALTFKIVLVLNIISLLLLAAGGNQYNTQKFFLLPTRFWELGTGVSIFLFSQFTAYKNIINKSSTRLVIVSLGTAGLIYSLAETDASNFPWPGSLLPTFSTALIIFALSGEASGVLHCILSSKIASFLGKRSYSIYLWHWPVLVLFRWTTGLDAITFQAASIAIILVLAHLSYKYIETPGRNLNKKISNRTSALGFSGICIVICMSLSGLMFYLQPSLTISRTGNRAEWYAEEGYKLFSAQTSKCVVTQKRTEYEGGTNLTFTPSNCKIPLKSHKLHVAGDSHANAYIGMLRAYADQEATEVILYVKAGCSFISLLRTQSMESPTCRIFFRNTLAKLNENIQEGDSLFLPSLRLRRIRDQWGGVAAAPANVTASTTEDLVKEGAEALVPIASRGAVIIFEAPKPIFGIPSFRCADWFNKNNPICTTGRLASRDEIERLREPIIFRMKSIQSLVTNVEIWDPLPVLCDTKICSTFRDDRPLFFDGDHLSGYGNRTLFDSFSEHMHDTLNSIHRASSSN